VAGSDGGARISARLALVRLFVAVRPPDAVLDVVARLRRLERPGVRWTTRPQWHVTLRFLGEVDDPAPVAAALEAAPLAACVAVVGPQVVGLGRGVVVVPVGGVDELAAGVGAATGGFGVPPGQRAFRGHLSLARVRSGRLGDLTGERIDARFPVDQVRLVRSHLGSGGACYDDLYVRQLD
jgi:2'-5' RNA ligase